MQMQGQVVINLNLGTYSTQPETWNASIGTCDLCRLHGSTTQNCQLLLFISHWSAWCAACNTVFHWSQKEIRSRLMVIIDDDIERKETTDGGLEICRPTYGVFYSSLTGGTIHSWLSVVRILPVRTWILVPSRCSYGEGELQRPQAELHIYKLDCASSILWPRSPHGWREQWNEYEYGSLDYRETHCSIQGLQADIIHTEWVQEDADTHQIRPIPTVHTDTTQNLGALRGGLADWFVTDWPRAACMWLPGSEAWMLGSRVSSLAVNLYYWHRGQ